MSGPENSFIGSVNRHLPGDLYRMKNHNAYNSGIADVWYSGRLDDLWVEYKFLVVPKRPTTVIDLVGGKQPMLSQLQQDWLRGRYEEGRNVAVIVGSKDGGVLFLGTTWEEPLLASEFKQRLVARRALAEFITSRTYG